MFEGVLCSMLLCCRGLSRATGRQEMISGRGTRTGVAGCQLVKRLAHSGKGRQGSDGSHNRLAGVMVHYHGHRLTQATWGC